MMTTMAITATMGTTVIIVIMATTITIATTAKISIMAIRVIIAIVTTIDRTIGMAATSFQKPV